MLDQAALRDALANAVAFLPVGVKNHPGVYVFADTEILEIAATDGYVMVVTQVPGGGAMESGFLSKAKVKDLLAQEEITIDQIVDALEEDEMAETIDALIGYSQSETVAKHSSFSFSPDRVKKLGALKPAGLPIRCRFLHVETAEIVAFQYGDSVSGCFTLLDEEGAT